MRLIKIGVNGVPLNGLTMDWRAQSSLLSAARQSVLDAAIKDGATHLFMIDDDMQFPRDVVDRMAAWDKDFVACNYVSKGAASAPTAIGMDGKIYSSGKTGLESVGYVGLGCCLLRLNDAVKAIPAPMFEVQWIDEKQSYLGEDFFACEKLRYHGIEIYIDHDLSNEIGHIGDFVYTEKTIKLLNPE